MGAAKSYDVVVIGGGNAGLTAALAARERGKNVLLLEKAPEAERGGNSYFSGGIFRSAHDGVSTLAEFCDLSEAEAAQVTLEPYSAEDYFQDCMKVTAYRANEGLIDAIVQDTAPLVRWLKEQGVKFLPAYAHTGVRDGDMIRMTGGAVTQANGYGRGLVGYLFDAAEKAEVDIWYGSRALSLDMDESGRVQGVVFRRNGRIETVAAKGVILASGGFSASPEKRAKYLGPGWDLARARGTRFNTGDGHEIADQAGAERYGNYSGCHAVAWDINAPEPRDYEISHGYEREFYPFGLMVNIHGKRFVDEGENTFMYTYAKYGKAVQDQPSSLAFQVFDQKAVPLFIAEYLTKHATRTTADSIPALGAKIASQYFDTFDVDGFVKTVEEYNASVNDNPFDPTRLDGKSTVGITPPKSNWATPLEDAPFLAYPITCGVTFTFGGIRIDPSSQVVGSGGPIPGLFATGEIVGGLYYGNYAGGTGLAAGGVFGRRAGYAAAEL